MKLFLAIFWVVFLWTLKQVLIWGTIWVIILLFFPLIGIVPVVLILWFWDWYLGLEPLWHYAVTYVLIFCGLYLGFLIIGWIKFLYECDALGERVKKIRKERAENEPDEYGAEKWRGVDPHYISRGDYY